MRVLIASESWFVGLTLTKSLLGIPRRNTNLFYTNIFFSRINRCDFYSYICKETNNKYRVKNIGTKLNSNEEKDSKCIECLIEKEQ